MFLVHGLKVAALPLITLIGLQPGFLLAGAVVVESIFNWPGIGKLTLDAVASRDFPMIQGGVLVAAVVFVVVNFLVDLLYAVLDPRVRAGDSMTRRSAAVAETRRRRRIGAGDQPRRRLLRTVTRSPAAVAGLVGVAADRRRDAAGAAGRARTIPPRRTSSNILAPPMWADGGDADHPLGTDALGRDFASRLIYGARYSLLISTARCCSVPSSGSRPAWSPASSAAGPTPSLMRLGDIQLAFPFILFAIAVLGVVPERTPLHLILVLGIPGWIVYARVVRSRVLAEREKDYVLAARALGAWPPPPLPLRPALGLAGGARDRPARPRLPGHRRVDAQLPRARAAARRPRRGERSWPRSAEHGDLPLAADPARAGDHGHRPSHQPGRRRAGRRPRPQACARHVLRRALPSAAGDEQAPARASRARPRHRCSACAT